MSTFLLTMMAISNLFSASIASSNADSCGALNVMESASLNQGLGFTVSQRENLGIKGLLPFGYRDIELQSKLIMHQINNKIPNDLDKYRYLMNIMEINEKLFYYTLINNLYQLMPIVYTPSLVIIYTSII